MRTTNYIISILALAVLTLMGCKDEIEGLQPCSPSDVVMFSTSFENAGNAPMTRSVGDSILMEVNDWVDEASLSLSGDSTIETAVTRSAPVTALSGSAGIYGYVYDDNVSASSRVFTNEKFNFDGDDLVPETPYAWKRLENLNKAKAWFCSYAPYEAGSQITPTMYNSNPGVTYTVPATSAEQIDFLYARSSEIDMTNPAHKAKIPFEYHHALTAIQFRMGFACKVKSVSIKNVKNSGTFTFANGWEEATLTGDAIYTFTFDGTKEYQENEMLVDGESTLMLLPQSFADDSQAKVELVYNDSEGDHTISASLANSSWVKGKKIVYTLYNEKIQANYVYFDLAAGNVTINASTYSGKIYVGGSIQDVTGSHSAANKYYVYQSTGTIAGTYSGANTGYPDAEHKRPEDVRIPDYPAITCGGKSWGSYITNNKDVVDVITKWNDNIGATYRTKTANLITISGASTFDVTIDNLYICSSASTTASSAPENPISFNTSNNKNSKLYLRAKGDSRVNNIQYNCTTKDTGHLYFTSYQGDGSYLGTITVASFNTGKVSSDCMSIIGPKGGKEYGLTFNGATIFAGYPGENNRVWPGRSVTFPVGVGGGNNNEGEVTINGGRLTAVANGTSPAIGGGGGYNLVGGPGLVTINGGETYAYAIGIYSTESGNTGYVPTTAIGGSSTFKQNANPGTKVTINGGYVYAESLGGTAIGGGNSRAGKGGEATIIISNNATVVAKSISGTALTNKDGSTAIPVYSGTAIGGGSSLENNGGDATVTITGGKLTTGSVGGGKTGDVANHKIGTATINISGSPVISGQFIMAAGASTKPSFKMLGGTILNSNTSDDVFKKVQSNGGAVYMEDGTCNISGGTIKNCSATQGGAIFMNGGTFNMSGGTISSNKSDADGGAVYISGGNATVTGGTISNNYAKHGNGGGVYLTGGNFSMPSGNGTITQNTANSEGATNAGSGGGIYIASTTNDVTAEIISGTITNNTADHDGGGMCVDMGGSAKATITIGAEGGTPTSPVIDHNSAALSGGGMCVLGTNSDITIYSGTIKGNVSAFVQNEDVRNDGGTVTLVGTSANCDVKYNTVIFHTNYDDADAAQNKTAEQRIVTHTNSKLAPPADPNTGNAAWTYEWHNFVRWNTQRDGTGTDYAPGTTMNISADVHLYAIWESTN